MELIRFEGNCPHNVAKDARYMVRQQRGESVVALFYKNEHGERWYATTEQHLELVKMVNIVKVAASGNPGGPFYINEYRQVIVPIGADGTSEYYLAGEYSSDLRFDFEGNVLSGEPLDKSRKPLKAGDEWDGLHPGIPYKLSAGGKDIYYRRSPRKNVTIDIKLSASVGAANAALMARRIRDFKGFQGGRFYINEWRTLFAPLNEDEGIRYVYLGQLGPDEPWFAKPHAS